MDQNNFQDRQAIQDSYFPTTNILHRHLHVTPTLHRLLSDLAVKKKRRSKVNNTACCCLGFIYRFQNIAFMRRNHNFH